MEEDRDELLKRIEELEKENTRLKERKKKKQRKPIKTTKKEIVEYWERIEDECGLSVDWAEAEERCWRCGCKRKLQKCHIIPQSLGGKDEPSNLVLLCERCHIDAPNVESETFMWDWIRANGTSIYDTFWNLRAQKEYEFIYHKSFIDELKERDILSPRDMEIFFSVPIGRSINHFAHPWKNDSTNAGLLRMRLQEYDKRHPNRKVKSKAFRKKEEAFDDIVGMLCEIAKQYKWNVWEGRTQNSFSITLHTFISRNIQKGISIKLARGGIYKGCFTNEENPNHNKASEYTIEIGREKEQVEKFVKREIEEFDKKYGRNEKQSYVFTINPIYHLREE